MKILIKIVRSLLTLCLIICINLLLFGLTAKNMFQHLINETMKTELSNQIEHTLKNYDIVTDNIKSEEISDILLNSKQAEELYNKYLNDILSETNENNINIGEDIATLIKEHQMQIENQFNIKITDEQINTMKEELNNSEVVNNYNEVVGNIKSELPPSQQKILSIYNEIQSKQFHQTLFFSITIIIVLLAILHKSCYKWLFNVGIACILASISLFAGISIIKGVIDFYLQQQLNILSEVNTNTILSHTFWILILGIILLVLYYIIKHIYTKKNHETI